MWNLKCCRRMLTEFLPKSNTPPATTVWPVPSAPPPRPTKFVSGPNSPDLTCLHERRNSATKPCIDTQTSRHNYTKNTHNSTRQGGLPPSRTAPGLGATTRGPTGWSAVRHKHHLHKSLQWTAPLIICLCSTGQTAANWSPGVSTRRAASPPKGPMEP